MRDSNRRAARRASTAGPFLWFLIPQLLQQIARLPYNPPVTLAVVLFNFICHIQPSAVPWLDIAVPYLCFNPLQILQHDRALLRLLGSAFVHGSDHHIYYNMASFVWKGFQLEQRMGVGPYAVFLVYMLVLSQAIHVAVAYIGEVYFGFAMLNTCAIGFSGVIFAMKYYLNASDHQGQTTSVHGIKVAVRYAAWVELVLISWIYPNVSFFGHLCGILAGALAFHTPFVPVDATWGIIEGLFFPQMAYGGGRRGGGGGVGDSEHRGEWNRGSGSRGGWNGSSRGGGRSANRYTYASGYANSEGERSRYGHAPQRPRGAGGGGHFSGADHGQSGGGHRRGGYAAGNGSWEASSAGQQPRRFEDQLD